MIDRLPKNKKLILFDGVCNLCNSAVQYVINHDKDDIFRFAPLQSELGRSLIKSYQLEESQLDSILLYSNEGGLDYKSTAALKIASHMDFPRNLMVIFRIVPTAIRNWVYDYVADNRYKWFGKKDECMIPTPELRAKFL